MTATASPPMAKKKAAKDNWLNKPKKPVVAQVRGSEAYKAWLDELCKADHRSIADLVELAVSKHAASIGFRPPPER